MPLDRWTLETPDGRQQAVLLPATMGLPDRAIDYRLTSSAALPAAWHGKSLSLAVPYFAGVARLEVEGERLDALGQGDDAHYRSLGPQVFRLPARVTARDHLTVSFEVAHRFAQSAEFRTTPRLSAQPLGDATTRRLAGVQAWSSTLGLGMLLTVTFTNLVLFLRERRRTHGWLALQTASAAVYTLFVLGATRSLGARCEIPLMTVGLVAAGFASVHYARAAFGLSPPHRIWTALLVGNILVALLSTDPFSGPRRLGPTVIVTLLIVFADQLRLFVRLARAPERRVGVVTNLVGWVLMGLTVLPDMPVWMGLGEPFGGLRLAGVGFALYSLAQLVALSEAHLASQRHAVALNEDLGLRLRELTERQGEIETLNAELKRQISDRSGLLANALARLRVGGILDLPEGADIDARYRIVRRIGSGATGVVYEALRLRDRRRLALKVLARATQIHTLARFAREAELIARVSHPNVVTIVDADLAPEGFMYFVMELVEGGSLLDCRERFGQVTWALETLAQVAAGLDAIHREGIVHRDLKLGNVMIGAAGPGGEQRVKIADFGVSGLDADPDADSEPQAAQPPGVPVEHRTVDDDFTSTLPIDGTLPTGSASVATPRAPSSGSATDPDVDSHRLTQTGQVVGTLAYMAPELARRATVVRPSADVFGFGVMAFELLTGRYPFRTPPALLALHRQQAEPAERFAESCPTLSATLAELFQRCLSLDAQERPLAAELVTALERQRT